MNRSERDILEQIRSELEKSLWTLRQLLDQVDAAHETEDKANTLANESEGEDG